MAKPNKFSEDNTENTDAVEQIHSPSAGEPGHVDGGANAAAVEGEKTIKSIVPNKYAAKYKDPSNDDALRTFIKEQCGENGKVNLPKFYELCRINGVSEDDVAKFERLTENLGTDDKGVAIKPAGGVAGRAVMTLRNRLTPVARKGDGVKGLDGKTYDVKLPPAPKTGAVAAAAEKKAAEVENAA